ncbi:DUF1643 domain-containing protein [Alcanivoracaceae bacterium MT1]
MIKGAEISPCGRYRWVLTRNWFSAAGVLPFVMLNPSTADAEKDDPTIRRCISFAEREGFGGIEVVNLYSFRATSPKDMLAADDPIGRETDSWLFRAATLPARRVVCAWGANAQPERVRAVADLIGPVADLVCLGTTKAGHPRHPLYVKGDQPLVPWSLPERQGDHRND